MSCLRVRVEPLRFCRRFVFFQFSLESSGSHKATGARRLSRHANRDRSSWRYGSTRPSRPTRVRFRPPEEGLTGRDDGACLFRRRARSLSHPSRHDIRLLLPLSPFGPRGSASDGCQAARRAFSQLRASSARGAPRDPETRLLSRTLPHPPSLPTPSQGLQLRRGGAQAHAVLRGSVRADQHRVRPFADGRGPDGV